MVKVELISKRADKANRDLVKWEKKLASARRKVAKLRLRVKYYAKKFGKISA